MKTKFTKEQLSIISSPKSKKLISASAGTGKTHTLVGAAEKVIKEKGNKTAIFTFTNAAADELKERMEVLPTYIGTIHSFALREIERMDKEGVIASELMSTDQVRRLLLNSYSHLYPIRRDYKRELSDIMRYMLNKDYMPDISVIRRYDAVINLYNKRKRELNLYDNADAPEYLVKKMAEVNWKLDYTHLFVDEVQDIDTAEFTLISSFEGDVFAIGDPRQNIYQFRNSIDRIFEKLEKMGYNLYILTESFRSYQEILDFADARLKARRGTGGVIMGVEILDVNPDTVILCRYNHYVRRLEPYFNNVYTVHAYKGKESDDVLIVDFIPSTEEEENIMFVAKTRARNRLGIAKLEDIVQKGRKIKYGL